MIHDALVLVLALWTLVRWWHVVAVVVHLLLAVATFVVLRRKGYVADARGVLIAVFLAPTNLYGLIVAGLLPGRTAKGCDGYGAETWW